MFDSPYVDGCFYHDAANVFQISLEIWSDFERVRPYVIGIYASLKKVRRNEMVLNIVMIPIGNIHFIQV